MSINRPLVRRSSLSVLGLLVAVSFAATASAQAQPHDRTFKFDLAVGPIKAPSIKLDTTTTYTKDLGYGFEPGADLQPTDRAGDAAAQSSSIGSNKPFYFSVALPEGNYRVTVTLGDRARASNTTVKAELRRLMLENVNTAPGEFVTRSFIVNTRTPQIAGSKNQVRLKPREHTDEARAWDDKLTLEFNGSHPAVSAIDIAPADELPTVCLLGDSTVCDQPLEPWNSWGQMLPRFFKPEVAIANHAESGDSLRSALSANRLEKVLSTLKSGDYLFIQYGHNDMKAKGEGVGAFTTYKADLERFVRAAQSHGATPVLVTSMHRNKWEDGHVVNSLGDYPEAVRQVAKEQNVPLIDLNAMSQQFYEALGPNTVGKAFQDGTHHNNYGSYELAKCIVEGIRQNNLPLARLLIDDLPTFDPNHPDPIAEFHIAASPSPSTTKPDGN